MNDVLHQLQLTLDARKSANPEQSYVALLHQKGINKILEKIGEEATETILAAKDLSAAQDSPEKAQDVIYEVADLWFHSLVMLSHLGIPGQAVLDELARRFDLSGITEKAQRKT